MRIDDQRSSTSTIRKMDADAEQMRTGDRRRHRRLAVTLSARIHHAEHIYRACILDVSDGGLLLSPIDGLPTAARPTIEIDAFSIGKIKARVVCISRIGIHTQIESAPESYYDGVRRLALLVQPWDANKQKNY